MKSRLTRVVLVCGVAVAAAAPSAAMDASTGLGAGMHAFHGGDYPASFDWLSGVIAAGSRDPRAFYFRGLAARRSGREMEAEADFLEGARLESLGEGGPNIGRALERVQGADRLLVERYRAKARTSRVSRDLEAAGRRYSTTAPEPDESIFRRRRPEVEGDDDAKKARPERDVADEPAADDVFAEEPRKAKAPLKPEAEEPAADGGKADPFGDDPFGATDGEPAERKAGEAKGTADAANEQAEREPPPAAVDDFN